MHIAKANRPGSLSRCHGDSRQTSRNLRYAAVKASMWLDTFSSLPLGKQRASEDKAASQRLPGWRTAPQRRFELDVRLQTGKLWQHVDQLPRTLHFHWYLGTYGRRYPR